MAVGYATYIFRLEKIRHALKAPNAESRYLPNNFIPDLKRKLRERYKSLPEVIDPENGNAMPSVILYEVNIIESINEMILKLGVVTDKEDKPWQPLFDGMSDTPLSELKYSDFTLSWFSGAYGGYGSKEVDGRRYFQLITKDSDYAYLPALFFDKALYEDTEVRAGGWLTVYESRYSKAGDQENAPNLLSALGIFVEEFNKLVEDGKTETDEIVFDKWTDYYNVVYGATDERYKMWRVKDLMSSSFFYYHIFNGIPEYSLGQFPYAEIWLADPTFDVVNSDNIPIPKPDDEKVYSEFEFSFDYTGDKIADSVSQMNDRLPEYFVELFDTDPEFFTSQEDYKRFQEAKSFFNLNREYINTLEILSIEEHKEIASSKYRLRLKVKMQTVSEFQGIVSTAVILTACFVGAAIALAYGLKSISNFIVTSSESPAGKLWMWALGIAILGGGLYALFKITGLSKLFSKK